MNISEVMPILKMQFSFGRTITGRSITEHAVSIVKSSMDDANNQQSDAIQCKNCCIIISSLLAPSGCQNCGSKDMDLNIKQEI